MKRKSQVQENRFLVNKRRPPQIETSRNEKNNIGEKQLVFHGARVAPPRTHWFIALAPRRFALGAP
jgi:hypothetical protein